MGIRHIAQECTKQPRRPQGKNRVAEEKNRQSVSKFGFYSFFTLLRLLSPTFSFLFLTLSQNGCFFCSVIFERILDPSRQTTPIPDNISDNIFGESKQPSFYEIKQPTRFQARRLFIAHIQRGFTRQKEA